MAAFSRFPIGRATWRLAWVLTLSVLFSENAGADRIRLRGGGEIQGVVLPATAEAEEAKVLVLTRSSSRPLEFRPEQVVKVIHEQDELREYLDRREQERTSGEEEFQFGLWCEQNGLTGPAEIHYRNAVELDQDHAGAHKKLGHVLYNGSWMTYDEQRQRQGLIKYKGHWISPQEKQELDEKEAFSSEQQSWVRRLKILRQKWLSGDEGQRQEAEEQLAAIREPAAVLPLIYVFGNDAEAIRIRLGELIAAIPGPKSIDALIQLILSEPNLDVREATLQQLHSRHDLETVPKLIRALRHQNPIVVGRAAWTLGLLNAVEAVPKLIPVLVKVEERVVFDPWANQPAGGVSFGSFGPGPLLPPGGGGGFAVSGGASGMVGSAYVGGGASIPIVTGPVVAPGAVAFGATSIPFGAYSGMTVGGGANPHRPAMKIQTDIYRNEEVLLALKRLTGQNFGYDIPTWRQWMRLAFRPQTAPTRSVPQP